MVAQRQRRGAQRRQSATTGVSENLRRAALAAILVGLFGGGWWLGQRLTDPQHLPLRKVHLKGQLQHLHVAEIRPTLRRYLGRSFIAFDINAMQRELLANPWVDAVAVRRVWPDSVSVNLMERRLLGRWGSDELIDVNGRRFRPQQRPSTAGFPLLDGPEGQEATVLDGYHRASGIVRPLGLTVAQLEQSRRHGWRLKLSNGIEVILSRDDAGTENFIDELELFARVYPRVLSPELGRIVAFDMRHRAGFTIRRADAA